VLGESDKKETLFMHAFDHKVFKSASQRFIPFTHPQFFCGRIRPLLKILGPNLLGFHNWLRKTNPFLTERWPLVVSL